MNKYYKILGLEEGASKEEVFEAYQKLSNDLDPAKNDNLDFFIEEYQKVQEAYEMLSGSEIKKNNDDKSEDDIEIDKSIIELLKNYRSSSNDEKPKILKEYKQKSHKSTYKEALEIINKSEIKNKPKTDDSKKNNGSVIKKFLIGFGVLFIILMFLTYLNEVKSKDFDENILPNIELREVLFMERQKEYWINKFRTDYPNLKNYFQESPNTQVGNLNFEDAMVSRDTVFKFLFFTKTKRFKGYQKEYFKCAYENEVNKFKNSLNNEYVSWSNKIKKRYNLSADSFNQIIKTIRTSNNKNGSFPFSNVSLSSQKECRKCIPNFTELKEFNLSFTSDFHLFIKEYLNHKKLSERQNRIVISDYNKRLNRSKRTINNSLFNTLKIKLDNNSVLNNSFYNYSFSSDNLGDIKYTFEKKSYDEDDFNNIENDVLNTFYSTNSLSTGSRPYSYCYGRNPSCTPPYGYSECSFIDVQASNSSDVVVLIQKNNKVFAHAYIKAGGYHKFKLGNGFYQTFFYYGKGWNPNKFIKNTDCGELRGGFTSNESIDKSEMINLFNSSMSYTLYTVENGNFVPKSSNKNEAF